MSRVVREGDGALLGGRVEATVTDEVEDVPGAAPHGPLQVAPGLPLEPRKLQRTAFAQPPRRLLNEPFFVLDV